MDPTHAGPPLPSTQHTAAGYRPPRRRHTRTRCGTARPRPSCRIRKLNLPASSKPVHYRPHRQFFRWPLRRGRQGHVATRPRYTHAFPLGQRADTMIQKNSQTMPKPRGGLLRRRSSRDSPFKRVSCHLLLQALLDELKNSAATCGHLSSSHPELQPHIAAPCFATHACISRSPFH